MTVTDAFSFYVHPAAKLRTLSLTVLLARHGTHDEVGQVLSGRSEIALNAEGRVQVQRLAARLAGTPITEVHTSPRRRARETAQIIAEQRSLDPEIEGSYPDNGSPSRQTMLTVAKALAGGLPA